MAKDYVKMTRTQTGAFGTFHAGLVYEVTEKTAAVFAHYVARGFAEKTQKPKDPAGKAKV